MSCWSRYGVLAGVFTLLLVAAERGHSQERQSKILIVATNLTKMPGTDKSTGVWGEELVNPFQMFTRAGFSVDIASPSGGTVTIDKASYDPAVVSDETARSVRFFSTQYGDLLRRTPRVGDLNPDDYAALYVAGGHGAMWDISEDKGLEKFTISFLDRGKPVASVCHGPAFLAKAKRSDGRYAIRGYRVTGFSNAEEKQLQLDKVVPFSLEDELRKASGGKYVSGQKPLAEHVIRDRNLVTGQNPASTNAMARTLLKVLSERSGASRPNLAAVITDTEESHSSMESSAAHITAICPVCKGTGVAHGGPGNYPYKCTNCNGTGQVPRPSGPPPYGTDH